MRNNILRSELDAVIEHLKQDDPILTNGPNCREFEKEWSQWLGVKYSVFVNSGASANLLSMTVLKIKYPHGGEIIVPTLTWVSDIASVIQCGFTPIFVDINPQSLAMDTNKIIGAITDKTRAVFMTHVQGFDGLTDTLISELHSLNIPLIEDVCESHGATHNGKKLGSIGWMSNFSFYYAHHMTTIEGGMVCTDDEDVYETLRMLRSHGMVREASLQDTKDTYKRLNPELNSDFIFFYPAYNMRNNEIGGILGRKQLPNLDKNVILRNRNHQRFLEKINKDVYQTDFLMEGSSNYAFQVILKEPNNNVAERLMNKLRDNSIEFRRGSAGGGNQVRQPYIRNYVKKDYHLEFSNTEHIHFYGFYIGNFPTMSLNEVDEICEVLNEV